MGQSFSNPIQSLFLILKMQKYKYKSSSVILHACTNMYEYATINPTIMYNHMHQ